MDPLHLLIVADDPLVRAGLTTLLAELPDCEVVGQVSSEAITAEFPPDFAHYLPDAIIWDMGWELADPLPDWPATNIPIVTLITDDLHTSELWQSGIRVILRRDIEAEKILDAARAACQGLIVLDPKLSPHLLPLVNLPQLPTIEELTPRESEVIQLLAEGLTNKAIAQRLEISEHTVKFHVNAIMSKLGAQSRTEAVVQATRLGLILL